MEQGVGSWERGAGSWELGAGAEGLYFIILKKAVGLFQKLTILP
jgi:hypothetical protein